MQTNSFKRYTVTAALPYVNGPLHIGHLGGVYVPADIYVRYLRSIGVDVLFIGGSDEHGVPITIKAKQEGVTPQQIVDKYHNIVKNSFEEFGISFDIYSRTSQKIHHETAADFFKVLYDKGQLVVKEVEQYFDEEANEFLADRYISGTCPHCNFERAYGDQCEKCGTSLSPTDLIEPKSMLTGTKPILKTSKHWFLPLDKYEEWLSKWILEEHKEWKPNVLGQCKSWIQQGLQPRAVTRDLSWGVQVPLADAQGKVLYVWFDAPIGYISATKEWAEQSGKDWKQYWQDKETRLIHFIGKDNIVFHCIIFPTMLKAEGSFILPDNVPANEFLNLEGNKISTSQNWAVWLHEYLIDFPEKQDVLRYTLTSIMPETKDSDFTWKDFQAKNNNELLAIFGNFVNRTMVLIDKYYSGLIPSISKFRDDSNEVFTQIDKLQTEIEYAIEHFRFRDAQNLFMDIARVGNKYLTDNEPWKKVKEQAEHAAETLFVALQILAKLSIVGEPFLPLSCNNLRNLLNFKPIKWIDAKQKVLINANHKIEKPILLFEKIEDFQIQQQLDKLQASIKQKQSQIHDFAPLKENVSFEDFSAMDIRIATIKEAVKVPKTKKLLKLLVDTGIDTRTIVSGIADQFEPEHLIGKQITVLLNLQAREIKGIQSDGMILLAEDGNGKLTFVVPENETLNGSNVK